MNLIKKIRSLLNRTVGSGELAASNVYDSMTLPFYYGGGVSDRDAMNVSAVLACVSLIGGAIAGMPLHLYKRNKDHRNQEGRERYDDNIWWLLNESPYDNWTASGAWKWMMQSILLRGDGYMRIHRDNIYTNSINSLEPLNPDYVYVNRINGRNIYTIYDNDTKQRENVDASDILHFSGIGFDGVRSLTPIRAALGNAIAISISADQYTKSFFQNSARPDFVLTTDNKVSEQYVENLRKMWVGMHGGSGQSHKPAILSGGLKLQQLTMTSEDAQLIQTRKLQVEDICRIMGVPPHMIGYTEKSTSWGSGIEQMSIGFVRYTLASYLDGIQQEINRKIWPRSLKIFSEFNRDALLDGDSNSQANYFSKALGGPGSQGWMTINEVRKLKNMKPLEDDFYNSIIKSGNNTGNINV